MSQESITTSTTESKDCLEKTFIMNENNQLETLDEQHLMATLEELQKHIPEIDNMEFTIDDQIRTWNSVIMAIRHNFKDFITDLKEKKDANLTFLEGIDRQCNDLFREIIEYFSDRQRNNCIKYYYNVEKLFNEHLKELKELCLLNYLINDEYDFYHQLSITGKLNELIDIINNMNDIYINK